MKEAFEDQTQREKGLGGHCWDNRYLLNMKAVNYNKCIIESEQYKFHKQWKGMKHCKQRSLLMITTRFQSYATRQTKQMQGPRCCERHCTILDLNISRNVINLEILKLVVLSVPTWISVLNLNFHITTWRPIVYGGNQRSWRVKIPRIANGVLTSAVREKYRTTSSTEQCNYYLSPS